MALVRALFDTLRVLLAPSRQRPRRVVIYGRHPPTWIAALNPEAPVWRGMAGVESVALARTSFELLLAGHRGGGQSIVIPLRERNILRCPRLYWGLLPSRRAVDILGDKQRFADYAVAQGLADHIPETYRGPAAATFPCVVKRVDLDGGEGVAVAKSAAELRGLLAAAPWRGHRVVLQALVHGDDHVTHCLCRKGRIIWHRTYRYVLRAGTELQKSGTALAAIEVAEGPEALAMFERFLLPLGYDGPANIDTRRGADGVVKVLEINPRLGGSLMRPEKAADRRELLAALVASAEPMGGRRRRAERTRCQ